MFRSEKLTKQAQNYDCQSCGKYKPSVPAHANWQEYGKGASLKAHDCFVAFVCPHCHDLIDGRVGYLSADEKKDMWTKAWLKTIVLWFEEGIVNVK